MDSTANLATIRHYFEVATGQRADRPLASFFSEDVVWRVTA